MKQHVDILLLFEKKKRFNMIITQLPSLKLLAIFIFTITFDI